MSLLLALLLAGCADQRDTAAPPAPVIDAFGANATQGDAPLHVRFHVAAHNADRFRLDFGDGANATGALPAPDLEHAYPAGAHAAVLHVYGKGQEAQATQALTVRTPAGGSGYPMHLTSQVTLPCGGCAQTSQACLGLAQGQDGLDCVWFPLPADAAGRRFQATSDQQDMGVRFRTGCAPGDTDGAVVDAPRSAGRFESGTVPEGARCVLLYENQVPGAKLLLDIS